MDTHPVLISGAGPVGLVLAFTLKENGVPVRIIDKIAPPRIGFKGSTVQVTSMSYSRVLLERFALAQVPGNVQPLRRIARSPHSAGSRNLLCTIFYLTERQQYAILSSTKRINRTDHTWTGSVPAVTLERSSWILLPRTDGVTVQLVKKLPSGATETETVDGAYLVGTDGAHSTVRKKLGLTFQGEIMHEVLSYLGSKRELSLSVSPKRTMDDTTSCAAAPSLMRTSANRETFLHTFREVTKRDDIQFGELN
ncbi:FAD-binding monooxygenase [Mucidula mucida]|nr:FAD-binding monooxygenase [Mucidula mucida]